MKAKTTKFLAVLAVLAMAFAGVAVFAQEQTNDADEVTATTAATYDKDVISEAGISKIKLEETAGAKSVVLYKNAGKDADNKPIAATNIVAGNAYYVNVDSIIVIPSGSENTWDKAIFTFFVLEGKEVNFVTANPVDDTLKWNAVTGIRLISVASEEDGIITLNEARAGESAFAKTGYAGKVVSKPSTDANYDDNHAEFVSYKAIDKGLEVGIHDYSVKMKARYGVANNFYFTDAQVISVVADAVIDGSIPIVFFPNDGTKVEFENFTGTVCNDYDNASGEIKPTSATIELENFTGKVWSVYGLKTPVGEQNAFSIEQTGDGAIKATNKYTAILLEEGSMIKFAEGATIDGVFGHVDEYGDWHAIGGVNTNEKPMTAGIDGLTMKAEVNKLVVRGNVQLEAATTLTMLGNVTISGMIYTTKNNVGYDLTLSNQQADIKLAGLQVVGSGKVTLNTSVLVTAGTSFLVKGELEVSAGAVLKVAENAVVKAEGELTMGAAVMAGDAVTTAAAAIWNAGQVIVPNYIDNETTKAYDAQLIRVYMNSTAGTGKFFAGSVEYNGTLGPLAVAYGAYLDVTGKCSVNLTSGDITVVNNLYKYKTMILATKDTTIPLTVDYDNQYPAEFNLRGKDYDGPETTAQSAVYRNVVWETPSVATIYVTAPEVYTVVLVKTYDEDTGEIDSVWTDGLVVKDPQGRIIPISQEQMDGDTVLDKGGEVKLVFGEKYTITGAIEENDYSFVDVDKVFPTLKKDSQIEGSFTMIRNLEKDNNNKEVPAEILVEMGKATVVTVSLSDAEKRIAAGDVVLSYSVDDGKTYKDVVKPATAADPITFNIFSNQTVLLKYPAVEFFKFTASLDADPSATAAAVPYNVINKTTSITTEQAETGCINAFEILNDEDEPVKATIGLTCALDEMEQTFTFDKTKTTATAATLTITFEEGKYYLKTGGHKAVETINFSTTGANPVTSATITMYKGEVFSMTWTDVPDAREKMTYASGPEYDITIAEGITGGTVTADKATARAGEIVTLTITKEEGNVLTGLTINENDLTNKSFVMPAEAVTISATFGTETEWVLDEVAPTATGTEYVSGTAFTVDKEYTFTLAVDDIEYVNVKNSTNTEAVITDNDIAKDGVVLEAKKLKEKAIEQINENLVKLSVKGSYVISWSYKLTVVEGEKTEYVSGTVSGASALFNFQGIKIGAINNGVVTNMEITTINSERIVYWVQINQDENLRYDKYSAGGYMDDVMKVWATPATGFKITKIDVYYWTQESGKGDWYTEAVMEESPGETGTTVWRYIMPASDVLLVPDVDSNYATITYKNYDGTVLQETPQPKGALPVYSGATPVKPSTETESYRFVGWDPTPVIVTEDATYVAQFEAVQPTSTDVTIFLEKIDGGVKVTLLANDGRDLQAGTITFTYYYAYMLNNVWATGFKTCTAQADADGTLYQFNVNLSEQERFSETMWIEGTYTSADGAVESISELIVYQ